MTEDQNMQEYYGQPGLWNMEVTGTEIEKVEVVKALIPEDVTTVLDAGCGNGAVSNYLPGHFDITGVDFSKEALAHFKGKKLVSDLDNLPFPDGSFDLVLCSDVLEHILPEKFKKIVSELKRVSRKYLLIISPHAENLESLKVKCFKCGAVFHMNWHIRSLTLADIRGLFSDPFCLDTFTFFGDPWVMEPKLMTIIRQGLGGQLCYWPHAVCPLCKTVQSENKVPLFDTAPLEAGLREFARTEEDCIRHSEVAVLFAKERSVLSFDETDLPALLVKSSRQLAGPPLIVGRHCHELLIGSPLHVRETTCHNPELPYIVENQNMDWGKPEIVDGRVVRYYEDCGGRDCHAVFIFPVLAWKPNLLHVEYKDISSEVISIQIFDAIQGVYRDVGNLAGTNDGQWKKATFSIPLDIGISDQGMTFHFVTPGKCHPEERHALSGLFLREPSGEKFHAEKAGAGKKESIWQLPRNSISHDARWIARFTEHAEGLAYVVTAGGELCLLGRILPEMLIPQWIFTGQKAFLGELECSCGNLDTLRKHITELNETGSLKQKKIEELEDANQYLIGTRSNLELELEGEKQQAAREKESLEARVAELEGEKQQAAREKESLETRVAELEGEKQQAAGEKENLEAKVKELEGEKQQAAREKESLETRVAELEGEKQQAEREKENLMARVKDLAETLDTYGVRQYIKLISFLRKVK